MSKTVLITGGGGLIGKHLSSFLLKEGYQIRHLSRSSSSKTPEIATFTWDVTNGNIDESCIDGVDTIIHLAGENIAQKRWTKKRKEKIIKSRTDSIQLIYALLQKKRHQVKTLISASAIGYYGDRENDLLTEDKSPGKGFLSETCIAWEDAADKGKALGLRVVKLRTGLVLTNEGGALPQMARPIKLGLGASLGSGKQWISWIHLLDVLRMYQFAIETPISGAYNMTAPNPVTNSEFTRILAKKLNKPLWLPRIPEVIFRLAMGGLSHLILDSAKTSSLKIETAGFIFSYPTLTEALDNIYA